LNGIATTDNRYRTVVDALPTGTNEYIKTAVAGDWMVRPYNNVNTPMKLIVRGEQKRYALFQLSDGSYVEYDTETENFSAPSSYMLALANL
jgi:hypothetical protein